MTHNTGVELLNDLTERLEFLFTQTLGIAEHEAKAVAADAATHIADIWGGITIYIPKDFAAKISTRNKKIYSEYTGYNMSELSRKYDLSVQTLYKIIKTEREKNSPKQMSLFAPKKD